MNKTSVVDTAQSPTEALLYELIFSIKMEGKKFNCDATDVDENSVDAGAMSAVRQRLTSLGISPQSCEFDIRKVTYYDSDKRRHDVFFFDVDRHEWGAGYAVANGQIVAKLESTASRS